MALDHVHKGTGAVVKSGDSVTVDYQGTNWNSGKIFDQSYGRTPATFSTLMSFSMSVYGVST